MLKTLRKIRLKADRISPLGAGLFEWISFAVIGVFCYIFFCHQDVLITAGHSIEYLKGHITDFYSACKETDGTYGANYLPTTFILFAIWNIPMVIFGQNPDFFGDWSLVFTMWNKLLPTAAYFISGLVIYRIVTKRFAFDKRKATLTVFLVFSSPLAFFSQFFFCQYDIFTVLFMLLGMYFYFKEKPQKKDYALFALFFGIATTFKYFSILVFTVLLLLRVKDIAKDIVGLVAAVLPAAAETGFYFLTDRSSFKKSVFQFSALDYTSGFSVDLGEVSVNLMYVVMLLLIAVSYFTKPKNYNEMTGFAMYYSLGICFALFGMMFWHSQWIIFIVPFWVLSTVINKNYKTFLYVDILQSGVFLVYVVNKFKDTVADQCLLRYGVLNSILNYKQVATLKMSDIFVYNDVDMLFTILCATFLIGFVFKHPRFNFDKLNAQLNCGRFAVNIRFLAFSLAFIVGAFACLPNFAARPENLWRRFGGEDTEIVTVNNEKYVDEYTKLDKMTVQYVYIVCDDTDKSYKSTVMVDIIDEKTGKIEAHGEGKEKNIKKDDTADFTKLTLKNNFTPKQDRTYIFRFYTDTESEVSVYLQKNENEASYVYRILQKDYGDCKALYSEGDIGSREPLMRLTGKVIK